MASACSPRREPRRGSGWLILAGGVLLGASVACGIGPTQPSALPAPSATPPPPPRVTLISVDGLRPDAVTSAGAPNIAALALRGAYTFAAQTVYPSTTLPGHTSMLTGVEPSAHGVTFDDYRGSFKLTTATVLSLARVAGKQTVMVVGKDKLKQLAVDGTLDTFVLTTRGDADVVNEAIARITAGFDLMVVHLPQTDQTGHASGWMSAAYAAQVRLTDEAVGRLVAQLPAGTTIVLTADHGGQKKTHGSREALDMTIPWIITGPTVMHRGPLIRLVRTVDTAPTVLSLLGLPAPAGCAGKVVSEAFEPQ